MHPIELLRSLARTSWLEPEQLVPEAAQGLSMLDDDPAGLVLACRKLIEHHILCGPLWWLCGRVLLTAEPRSEARAVADEFANDPTLGLVVELLESDELTSEETDTGEHAASGRRDPIRGDASAHPIVVPAVMAGPAGFVVPTWARDLVIDNLENASRRPVWVIAGVGVVVPPIVWNDATRIFDGSGYGTERRSHDHRILDIGSVDVVIGQAGRVAPGVAVQRSDVPVAPELLRRG